MFNPGDRHAPAGQQEARQQQRDAQNNRLDGVDTAKHRQKMTEAFGQVLAQQIMENRDELTTSLENDPAYKELKRLQAEEERKAQKRANGSDSGEESSDIDFDDDDEELDRLAAARKQHILGENQEYSKWKALGHGGYDVVLENEFLPTLTKAEYSIVHFFHRDFERCKVVDKHLLALAPRYLPVRFVRIDAEKAPFFVKKLNVQVLPTILLFKDFGKMCDRLTGFEELGGRDDFTTAELEARLRKSGIMKQLKQHMESTKLQEDEKHNMTGGLLRVGGKFGADIEDNTF